MNTPEFSAGGRASGRPIEHLLLILTCLLLLTAGGPIGCVAAMWPTREGFASPTGVYDFHAPGIAGPTLHDMSYARGLMIAGVQEVILDDWTTILPGLNLSDQSLHEKAAAILLARLEKFHKEHPGARIILSSHSGGCAVVIRTAELAPEGLIEQVWLLAASLQPDYDFSNALDHVERIVAISSRHDWMILGAGTSLFGTSDGYHGDSGGMVGFTCTNPRLEQWVYDPRWLEYGNTGGHLEVLSGRFARDVIGPSMVKWLPVYPGGDGGEAEKRLIRIHQGWQPSGPPTSSNIPSAAADGPPRH